MTNYAELRARLAENITLFSHDRAALLALVDSKIVSETLCNDEGCPQHGTPHVCVTGFNCGMAAEAASKIFDYADLNVTMFDACCDEVPKGATDIYNVAKALRDLLCPEPQK